MKHIEQIQPEYAADDMTALLLSDATASAALSRLLHDWTGCAIPPTADTPQSEVEELVPLCLSILRRHWQTPLTALGDGTTPMSLADLMRRLIGDRVQGNEAWSIPAIHADIPTAVAALRQRDMSSGLTLTLTDGTDGSATTSPTTTSLPDGLSLAQLFCSGLADNITELHDSNKGWTMSKPIPLTTFPNATRMEYGCKEITVQISTAKTNRVIDIVFPHCTVVTGYGHFYVGNNAGSISPNVSIHFDALETTNFTDNNRPCASVGKLFFPMYKRGAWRVNGSNDWSNSTTSYIYIGCKGEKTDTIRFWGHSSGNASVLTDIEIREGACQNLTFDGLKNLTAENMYNHILCRLKQDEPMCGEGVTITLGTTNLDKLEAVEEYNLKLTELTDTYGYTFA